MGVFDTETFRDVPTVLTIAGFDPCGGAGIQGDTKTITATGTYATNVLTSLPIQNTYGVKEIFEIPTSVIEKQLHVVFEDMIPKAVKIGMLHSPEIVELVADFLKNYEIPIVFDPVMIATSGDSLIKDETVQAFSELLFPIATLITPNLDETSVLVGETIDDVEKMKHAGRKILDMNVNAVLIKGGHLTTETLTSILFMRQPYEYPYNVREESHLSIRADRISSHGAGCTLSSAIASYLAIGYPLEYSVKKALDYTNKAIRLGDNIRVGEQHKHELLVHLNNDTCYLHKTKILKEEAQ